MSILILHDLAVVSCAIVPAPIPALASSAWLTRGAFSVAHLSPLADAISRLPPTQLPLVKAFSEASDSNAFGSQAPSIQWACDGGGASRISTVGDTLHETLGRVRAPISARVASAPGFFATAALRHWLQELESICGRRFVDADAYLTRAPHSSSSLGWHVDDVDVLLVMLDGRKRFRVASTHVGSEPIIDVTMAPGDACYIPALTFHTGGSTDDAPTSSVLLSVALPPQDAAAKQEAVRQWRAARVALLRRLPAATRADWQWAGSDAGASALQSTLGQNEAWSRFLA